MSRSLAGPRLASFLLIAPMAAIFPFALAQDALPNHLTRRVVADYV